MTAAFAAHLGLSAEAEAAAEHARRLQPGLSSNSLRQRSSWADADTRAMFLNGLKKGWPSRMTTRRLAAILAVDVAGFSAMMERDEEGTAARIKTLRQDVIEPALTHHHGRLVKTTGDGFLAEFANPVEAVRSALAIQDRLAGTSFACASA